MSPVTTDIARNFQEFVPFREEQLALLRTIFAEGDSDPRTSFGPGAENAIRLERSRELIASSWGLAREDIRFVADRYLAFHLAISGSIKGGDFESIAYSPIEKKEILAIIAGLDPTIERIEAPVSIDGTITLPVSSGSLKIHQLRNGETGISQKTPEELEAVIDATSAHPKDLRLPIGWRAVVLDASSWDGPRGVYPLAINPEFRWANPLSTLDTSLPTFGASYPLTLMAATSLEQDLSTDHGAIAAANRRIRDLIAGCEDVEVAGYETGDRLSLSFLYIQSEELQRRLYLDGFLVDSGSACSSSALEPSHVLTSMGLLSHGNVRIRIRANNLASIEALADSLIRHVPQLRAEA